LEITFPDFELVSKETVNFVLGVEVLGVEGLLYFVLQLHFQLTRHFAQRVLLLGQLRE